MNKSFAPMNVYLRVLAVLYATGAVLHLLDLFDLRLEFSKMDQVWRVWVVYLFVFDALAAIGLWRRRTWGIASFLTISISQLIAYLAFQSIFGVQSSLIVFHAVTLTVFILLTISRRQNW